MVSSRSRSRIVSLRPGAPGDLTILDLERELTIDPARFQSRSRNTPFKGWTLVGGPTMTIVGGKVVAPGPGGKVVAP